MKLSEKLSYILKVNKLTDVDLAKNIGVDPQVVSLWLNGQKEPGLQEYRLLCKQFGISLDYLSEDNPVTPNDHECEKNIQSQIALEKTEKECESLKEMCRNYLAKFNVPYDEAVLPEVKDGKIDFGCFNPNTTDISLDYSKLLNMKQDALIQAVFSKNVSVEEAIRLDNLALFQTALGQYTKDVNAFVSKYHNKPVLNRNGYGYGGYIDLRSPEFKARQARQAENDRLAKTDLDKLLENLNPNLSHYFDFIVLLIEAGAHYKKQVGYGDDVTCFNDADDISKTNFHYRVAKEMLALKV